MVTFLLFTTGFLGFRHILKDSGRVTRVLKAQAKMRLKKNLEIIRKMRANDNSEEAKEFIRQSINRSKKKQSSGEMT